ncbi:glucosyltransferase [Kalymmatonema gypsitolerans NIES-4073]|nr:glucosyltransferase [Scytonema sp. NIES-4073]
MSTNLWTLQKWQEVEQAYLNDRKGIRIHLAFKRLFDVLLSGILCLILLPVFALIALAVRLSSPGPILFRQERMGRLGQPFKIYKFRSMVDGAVHKGTGLATFKGDPRVTPIGQFLREYHLDELPQIFNVLLGDMSLVGPRPVLMSALPTYTESERRRLLMPPGITGWQQVNGGALNDVDERIKLDVWYVENWTWWLDLVILLKTIPVVLLKEGVYGEDGWQIGRGDPFELYPQTNTGEYSLAATTENTIFMPREELERLEACLKEAAGILHRYTPAGKLTSLESLEKTLKEQILEQVNPNPSLL